jgi:hypothetical protein
MKTISKIILTLAFTLLMVGSYIFVEFNPIMAETKVIDNGLYRIKNAYSGLYLDIQDGSNADGSFCVQSQRTENTSQIFRVSKENTLRYIISVEKNLKVLEIGEKTQEDIVPIQQNNYQKETRQEWTIRQLSDGTIVFLNYLSNDAISVTDGDLNDGGLVVGIPYTGTNNQKWTLEPIEKSSGTVTGNKVDNDNIKGFQISSIGTALGNASVLEIVVIGIIIFVLVFVLTGYILYALRVKPRFYIKGRLYYKSVSRSDEKFVNYMDFKRKHKKKITISFDQGAKKADFFLGSGTYDYQIIVENITEMTLPRFLEGYRSFDNDRNPIKLRVSATEPGILSFGEFVYSKHFIVDGSKFESGDILFRYVENDK